jgi:DNA (cytosine-5)-methyltransferase 1
MKKLKVATVFSGIGSFEFALKRLDIDHEILFSCDNGGIEIDIDVDSEFDKVKAMNDPLKKKKYVDSIYEQRSKKQNYVKKAYLANYNVNVNSFFNDIRLLDGRDFKHQVDILVGGSPCQSFSTVGFQHGLEDARGTLFYDFARLVSEIQPKVFIYENVRGLITHDNKKTWNVVYDVLQNIDNYQLSYKILNSKDFNIPQNRNRLFVIGVKNGNKFDFPEKQVLQYKLNDFLIDNCDVGYFKHDKNGRIIITKNPGRVEVQYKLSNSVEKYVLAGGTKNFYQKPVINLDIARPLLATMNNRHRAGIDNYFTYDNGLRMLTEREALRLMGFSDDFKIVVSKAQTYKQAGNSIVVDVFVAIIKELIKQVRFDI